MKTPITALVAIAMAVTLTSVAAAGPAATRQRVQIDLKLFPHKGFVLTPLETGALKPDSGTDACNGETEGGEVLRDGQVSYPNGCRAVVLTGKRGKLVLRYEYAWVEAGGDYNIATGTWKVVRGMGQYARVTGGGRSAEVGSPQLRLARFQGYLASP
jgi:hypothetical protein